MTCKKSPPAPTTAFSPTPERRRMSGEPSPTKLLFRPLPLGLEAKALADLLEGSLHLPAHNKPADDLLRLGSEVGAQQSLSLELLLRVTDQDPTQGHGGQTRAVPERRPRNDLSMVRLLLPYQLLSVIGAHSVVGSCARTERLGKRSPFRGGRPI